jgi:hypothetical protein
MPAKRTCRHACFAAALSIAISAPSAACAQCALWNQASGTITDQNGALIGQADLSENRAEDLQGIPLSQASVDRDAVPCVVGSNDGDVYDTDDLTSAESSETDRDRHYDIVK